MYGKMRCELNVYYTRRNSISRERCWHDMKRLTKGKALEEREALFSIFSFLFSFFLSLYFLIRLPHNIFLWCMSYSSPPPLVPSCILSAARAYTKTSSIVSFQCFANCVFVLFCLHVYVCVSVCVVVVFFPFFFSFCAHWGVMVYQNKFVWFQNSEMECEAAAAFFPPPSIFFPLVHRRTPLRGKRRNWGRGEKVGKLVNVPH